ncbi:RNA polymerase sigma factor 70 region 4 type 2 domain-containing protein [Paraburkholderia kururiensis]|uniref:hypothetical protein n=1 Tax=Paraburkholderia kururiensis TaxID=984307 RepID=UPI0039A6B025
MMRRDPGPDTLEHRLDNWGNAARGAYDAVDAAGLTRAWRTLQPRHREMLRMVYLWRADREVVCRRLHIPRRPSLQFDRELAVARAALVQALSAMNPDDARC